MKYCHTAGHVFPVLLVLFRFPSGHCVVISAVDNINAYVRLFMDAIHTAYFVH